MKRNEILQAALRDLRGRIEAGEHPRGSICTECEEFIELKLNRCPDDPMLALESLAATWPKASENNCFVVPSDKPGERPMAAFYRHQKDNALWRGEYGDLRKELLAYLVAQVDARAGMNA